MIKFFGLAIFASTCFLVGFFTGQWSTFSSEAVNALVDKQRAFCDYAAHIEQYEQKASELRLIRKINVETQPQFNSLWSKDVTNNINLLQIDLEAETYKPFKLLIQGAIDSSKFALEESPRS